MIGSSSNQQIKNLNALLKKAKERKEQRSFVIEGRKMFDEVRQNGDCLIKTYFSESFFNTITGTDGYLKDIDYEVVADSVFNQVCETVTPQGVMAVVKMPGHCIEDILKNKNSGILLLEDLRDPGNLGTIVRTAEAAGFAGIILSRDCVDMYNPKVIRSTMGGIYRLPFVYVDDFAETISMLQKENVKICAAHLKGGHFYDEEDYSGAVGVLIGNEANGLSDEISQKADILVRIPMEGKTESLNAAVAASVYMYEIYRQKRKNVLK